MNDVAADIIEAVAVPHYADILRRALAEHAAHADACQAPDCNYQCGRNHWLGFEWRDVRARATHLNELYLQGVLNVTYSSNKATHYVISDVDAVRAVLARADAGEDITVPEPITDIPDDLFSLIEGQERIKRILLKNIRARRPVHTLLVGPPASAKSLFLSELERLQPSRFVLGGTSSRAGLTHLLLAEHLRFLIVDEIDKMSLADTSALLSVMSTGIISRTHRHDDQQRRVHLWVFAAANSDAGISAELMSRFEPAVHLRAYGAAEFEAVAAAILAKHEGCDAGIARYIAHALTARGVRNPRVAQRCARVSDSVADVDEWLRLNL